MTNDDNYARGLNLVKSPEIRKKIEAAEQAAKIVQLPLWPEPQRCIPNEIVRSALFTIRNRNIKREYCESIPVVVIGDGSITYRGAGVAPG